MSEHKHTDGPWEANVEHSGDVFSEDLQIADCDFPQGELETEEIEANARLCAAAPDLLEACEATVKVYDGMAGFRALHRSQCGQSPECPDPEFIAMCRKAIARATEPEREQP